MGRQQFLEFMAAVKRWRLSVNDHLNLLGGMARSTYFNLQKDTTWDSTDPNIPRDTYERMATFVLITENLEEVLKAKAGAPLLYDFVRQPTPLFDGVSPLTYLLSPVSLHTTLYEALRVTRAWAGRAKTVQQSAVKTALPPLSTVNLAP